ncbi:hypothetical protein GCM10027020_13480 [Nocardioides salsibiostraticola]
MGMDPHLAAKTARTLETLHSLCYFVPEVEKEITALGVRRGMSAYFAGRAAPMGLVGPGPVTATFFVFSPGLVAHLLPGAWEAATPADVHAARYRGVSQAWTRLLGEEVLASAEMAEAAELARTAAAGCTPAGRALYAAHADLEWPTEPHMVLFHALTLMREHRGDGHVAALLAAGLDGLTALMTHTATGKGFTLAAAQASRGWSDEEWTAAHAELVERGLFTAEGSLTEAGVSLRESVESATDILAAAPWSTLGEEGTVRLRNLGRPWVMSALAGGCFPEGVFA